MLSAPPAIPATMPGTFTAGFTPHRRPMRTCSPARAARPAGPGPSSAPGPPATPDSGHQRMRGSSPGYATIALARCPLNSGSGSFTTPIVPVQGAPFASTRPQEPYLRGGSRLRLSGRTAIAAFHRAATGWARPDSAQFRRTRSRHITPGPYRKSGSGRLGSGTNVRLRLAAGVLMPQRLCWWPHIATKGRVRIRK